MRPIARYLLLLFAFTVPWEYSLDLGEPLGNMARIAGLLLLLAAIPAVAQAGRLRKPGAFQWVTLALFLWFGSTYLWTLDPLATLTKLRACFQEMMVVWLAWELVDTPADLRNLLRVTVAGSWVLAILTLVAFRSPEAIAQGQIRFFAYGQDPNDMARFLDLAFPQAALLFECDHRSSMRFLGLGFLPIGFIAVLLTASREGFLAALIALAGSAWILMRRRPRRLTVAILALPVVFAVLWFTVPAATLQRLGTIPEQLHGGDLNQRLNIWSAGWRAFTQAPLFGSGAGSFVTAAHLAPIDTAHNTALSVVVNGGLIALMLLLLLVAMTWRSALTTSGPLRIALAGSLLVWMVTTFVATVEENRATWLLLATIAVAGRLAAENRESLSRQFPYTRSDSTPDRLPALTAVNR